MCGLQFEAVDAATTALVLLHNTVLRGSNICVSFSHASPDL